MYRHVALFRFQPGTAAEDVHAVVRALDELPDHIDTIRGYRVGADAGRAEGNWDFAVVADFDDEAGYRTYRDHPAHQRVSAEVIRPILADRAAVQYVPED